MGRRSINSTKNGKYVNPTDQARKEARKKELKKNKKQQQLVRAAVLKGKDPNQIIEEMQKLDQMEYNVMQPPPINVNVLKEKRKKLKQTLDRVLKMYATDDHEKWSELKEQMIQYERRRIELVSYFESVKRAEQVQVDAIPLPPTENIVDSICPGSLEKPSMGIRLPPGPPPGMPRMMRPDGPMPRDLPPQIPMPGVSLLPPVPIGVSGLDNPQNTPNVLSAAPQLTISGKENNGSKSTKIIEAKPQLRDFAAEATIFLPTSLRVKRMNDKKKPSVHISSMGMQERTPKPDPQKPVQLKTKHDAYSQFMEELQTFL